MIQRPAHSAPRPVPAAKRARTAYTVCAACNRPMPTEALHCRCGGLPLPPWPELRPSTDAQAMLARLGRLAEGIGWDSSAAAGTVHTATAGFLSLALVREGPQWRVLLEDALVGTVAEARLTTPLPSAQRLAVQLAQEHVLACHGPQDRKPGPPMRPDPKALGARLEALEHKRALRARSMPGDVSHIIREYREAKGVSGPMKLPVNAQRPLCRAVDLHQVQFPRMALGQAMAVHLPDVPYAAVAQAARDLRNLRDAWLSRTRTKPKPRFSVVHRGAVIYVRRYR